MSDLTIAGRLFKAGSRGIVRVPVTRDLTGNIEITAHVVAGASEGPTLLLLSMLHGNEWFSVLILRELLKRIDPAALAGNIIAVPVANPAAFITRSRCILDDSDEPDANRSFGGQFLWLTNQITNTLAEQFFTRADCLIDYHVSDWGSTMADISFAVDYPDPEVTKRSREMALAFGFPSLHMLKMFSGFPGPRSSLAYAGAKYGLPGIVAEVGGLGFGEEKEREWLERNVEGTMGVMKQLGMLSGEPAYCDRYLCIGDRWRLSPRNAGYLEPTVGLDRQFTAVKPGEVLARLISPTSFEVLEELSSPGEGIIFYSCRSYMLRPGSWAFGIAVTEGGSSYWAARDEI